MKNLKTILAIISLTTTILSCSKSDDAPTTTTETPKIAMVTTIAGSTQGDLDGTGVAAKFSFPQQIAFDNNGNLYVTDSSNSKIKKITSVGVVSTFSGAGNGDVWGILDATKYSRPYGITVANNKIYVTDFDNHKIKAIPIAGGNAVLFAGAPLVGNLALGDETGNLTTSTKFQKPVGLAKDVAGNIYVVDFGNHKIKKLSPTTGATLLAGSNSGNEVGQVGLAKFKDPESIAIAPNGDIYVSDTGNHQIKKISPTGLVSFFAGSTISEAGFKDGQGAIARFNSPIGIAVDQAGNVYVADALNNAIRKITPTGLVSTVAGIAAGGDVDGELSKAKFNIPSGICIDNAGNLYVTDKFNHKIKKITFN